MKARYQYRFYPTDQQQQSLAQLFGCVRVAWNDALAFCKQSEKIPGYNKLSAMLTQSKKTDERKWLSDVSSVPLQQSLRHLDVAYKNFFNSRNGNRIGGKVGIPRFKKKTNSQSAEFTKAAFSVNTSPLRAGFREVYLNCNIEHDRDGNAAKNIEQVGMGNRHDSKRTQRNCKTITVTQNPLKRQKSPLL
jgi:transposase